MSNYTKVAVKGAATVLVVSLLAGLLGYLVRLVLARNLSVEQFGLFYAVFSFLGLVGVFKTFGFDKALIKFIPELKHKGKNDLIKSSVIYVSIIQLITNTVVIVFIYLFASYLSINFFHNGESVAVLKLMAIAFFIDSFVFILKFAFQGFKKMMLFAGIDVVRMLLILAIVMIGFKLNYKILSPVIAYILAPLVLLLIFTPVLAKKIFPEFSKSKLIFDMPLFRRISKYSIFVLATSVAWLALGYTDSIVLTYFSGLAAVGLYNVALPTAKVLTLFPTAITGIMQPLTSELWAKRKHSLLKDGMEILYKYSILIILPVALVMFSYAELLIKILYGASYVPASNAMRILSIGMIFGTIYGINFAFFAGIGKPEINSKIVYIAAAFNLIADFALIPFIGIIGAAIATTTSYFIMMFAGLKTMRSLIDFSLPVKLWAKTFFSGAIFIFIIWFLRKIISLNVWLETSIVLAISGIAYLALLFAFKVIEVDELKVLYKRIRG